MNDIKLTDFISVSTLQNIQDGFSDYSGMAALIVDADGTPITKGSGFTKFCMELTRKSAKGCKLCEQCDKNGALLTLNSKRAMAYECHAGLLDYAAPIMVDGIFVGGVIGGQVRSDEVDTDKFRDLAIRYGIEPDEYIQAAKDTKMIEKKEVERAATFLEIIANSISEMAYSNYQALKESERLERVSKSQAEFVMNMSMNLERAMERWFNIVEKTMRDTKQKEVYELLDNMHIDGLEMRSSIKSTVDYIRMSASEIELTENVYQVGILKELVQVDNIAVPVECLVEDEQKSLFGDVGRIGQFINQMLRTLGEEKQQGHIGIRIWTEKKKYAAFLNIEIVDEQTKYTKEQIMNYKEEYANYVEDEYLDNDNLELGMSLEHAFLHKMNAGIEMDSIEGDMIVKVRIPQLPV